MKSGGSLGVRVILASFIALLGLFNVYLSHVYTLSACLITGNDSELGRPLPNNDSELKGKRTTITAHEKMSSISSFWWPSPETSGGILSAIHAAQNPEHCSSKATKFFVFQSLKKNEHDNRGISAWAATGAKHMLHAFSDGDKPEGGRRVLITDDAVWPMAKGCQHGPETRECYFLPLTKCKLSDVDPIDAKDGSVALLSSRKDEYDRSVRTLYSSRTHKWARDTKDKISWTGLPGREQDYSATSLAAAFLVYQLQPQPWLREEIDRRLQRSLPKDLDPDRTIGVPIRRSDKCFGHEISGSAAGELDCPPLEEYLNAVKKFLAFDPLINSIIVTSEDSSACAEFIKILNHEFPTIRIVDNVGDVQQGTGSASKLESYKDGVSNSVVIASALTSLHMHLRARYFVLTTKSTWTSSIAILARVYGFSADVYVIDIGRNTNSYSELARVGG